MSDRYISRAVGYIADDIAFDWTPDHRTITVIEDERRAVKTGLLDAAGNELYRVPESVSFGFIPYRKRL